MANNEICEPPGAISPAPLIALTTPLPLSVPPRETRNPEDEALFPLITTVPLVTVVEPVSVFVPARTCVPLPVLVNPKAGYDPPRDPEKLKVCPVVT
jgi:hypothetical protein